MKSTSRWRWITIRSKSTILRSRALIMSISNLRRESERHTKLSSIRTSRRRSSGFYQLKPQVWINKMMNHKKRRRKTRSVLSTLPIGLEYLRKERKHVNLLMKNQNFSSMILNPRTVLLNKKNTTKTWLKKIISQESGPGSRKLRLKALLQASFRPWPRVSLRRPKMNKRKKSNPAWIVKIISSSLELAVWKVSW